MQSVLVALAGGLGLAISLVGAAGSLVGAAISLVGAAGPSTPSDEAKRSAEVESCLRGCDAQQSSTDRSTCRLQCEEKTHSKREPDVVRYKRTEYYDGLPDGAQKGGTVTTTTERSPMGTTTTTTNTTTSPRSTAQSSGRAASGRAVSPYVVLAQCQSLCDVERVPAARATCKLQCLSNPRHRTPAATTSTDASIESRCRAQCEASEATPGARATCTHNCVATETARTRPTAQPKASAPAQPGPASPTPRPAKTKTQTKPDPAAARACPHDCYRRGSACADSCGGTGSDKSTCELQCNQSATRCAGACS